MTADQPQSEWHTQNPTGVARERSELTKRHIWKGWQRKVRKQHKRESRGMSIKYLSWYVGNIVATEMSPYEINKDSSSPLKKTKKQVGWNISRKSSTDRHQERSLIHQKLGRTWVLTPDHQRKKRSLRPLIILETARHLAKTALMQSCSRQMLWPPRVSCNHFSTPYRIEGKSLMTGIRVSSSRYQRKELCLNVETGVALHYYPLLIGS